MKWEKLLIYCIEQKKSLKTYVAIYGVGYGYNTNEYYIHQLRK